MSDQEKSNTVPIVLGGGLALAIGVAAFWLMPEPEMAVVEATSVTAEPVAPEVVEPQAAPAVLSQAPAAPVEPVEPAAAMRPEFDTFRVELDGTMVIAGRAEPGQVVDIILAGEAIERVTADSFGTFVALPVAAPSELPRRLSLLADPEGSAIGSATSYIVAPIAKPVIVAVAPVEDIAATDTETIVADAEVTAPVAPQPVEPEVAVIAPAPPTVLQADADGVRVVQGAPTREDPEDPNVAFDAITYDPDGEVRLSGRAIGDGSVQIYIDNEPLTTSPVTEGGDWRVILPQVDTGVYTLRIDEVDSEGTVVSRLETPFKREEAEDVATALAAQTSVDGFEVAVKTVQPGATLWAIAEENLGRGIFYIEVFEANADLIRDPDLIYPGQIFRIPDMSE